MSAEASAVELLRLHYDVTKALIEREPARVLSAMAAHVDSQVGIFWQLEPDTKHLVLRSMWSAPEVDTRQLEAASRSCRLGEGEGKPGEVWRRRAPMWTSDLANDSSFSRRAPAGQAGLQSGMWLPIQAFDEFFGILEFLRRDATAPDPEIVRAFETMAQLLGLYMHVSHVQDRALAAEQTFRISLEAELAKQTDELRKSELKLQRLYDAEIVGILVGTYAGDLLEANDAFLNMMQYTRAEVAAGSVSWRNMTPPEWARADARALDLLMTTGNAPAYEKEFIRKDGTRMPVLIGAALLEGTDASICYVLDISRQKKVERDLAALNARLEDRFLERTAELHTSEAGAAEAERQLRALALRLMNLREETGARIAREIHDVLGQELTGLKMDAAWLLRRVSQAAFDGHVQLVERLEAMLKALDRTVRSIRGIASELRPQMLDDLGLVAALSWSAREFSARSGIHVETSLPDEADLDRARSTALFRISQELLTNVARHSGARKVTLTLSVHPDSAELRVCDDGTGYDPNGTRSLGIVGIRERALAFGGTFTIGNVDPPATGTDARVRVPLGASAQ